MQLFLTILSLSLSSALIGLIILLTHPITQRLFSKRWNYYIWLLVIARLLIPVHFNTHYIALQPNTLPLQTNDKPQQKTQNTQDKTTIYNTLDTQNTTAQNTLTQVQDTANTANTQKQNTMNIPNTIVEPAAASNPPETLSAPIINSSVSKVSYTNAESNVNASANTLDNNVSKSSNPDSVGTTAESILWVLLVLTAAVFCVVWLFGAAISLLRKLRNYRHFVCYMQENSIPATNTQVQQLAKELSQKLSIKKTPVIYKSTAVSSPITIGLWNPSVILPQDLFAAQELHSQNLPTNSEIPPQDVHYTQFCTLTEETTNFQNTTQLRFILQHELIHIARKDLWYKWIFQLLLSIHWFNPILHIIGRTISIDCELSCDEAVLAHMDLTEENKKAYGNLLLDTAQKSIPLYRTDNKQISKAIAKGTVFSTTLLARKSDLKKRLNGIIYYKKQTALRLLLSVCTFVCVLTLSACSDMEFSLPEPAESYFTETDNDFSYHTTIAELYYDDQQIADKDVSDRWVAYSYQGMGNKIKASGFMLSGSDTIQIIYATEDIEMQIDTAFKLYSGNFKVVHIAPDNTVTTVSAESGEQTSQKVTLPKGRNAIKMVGNKAKLRNLTIEYTDLKNAPVDGLYSSESQEYIGLLLKDINNPDLDKESLDISKIVDALPTVKDKEASALFKAILDRGITLNQDELINFIIYSDKQQSSKYLVEALENGTITALEADTVISLMPYFPDTYKSSLLITLPAAEFPETFGKCLPFLTSSEKKECCEYLAESMQNGTITLAKPVIISDYMPYLSSGSRAPMILALPTADFYNVFVECLPYLNSSEKEECLLHYLDAGGTLTYTQFSEISPYLSSSLIRKIDNY